jgi:hypothetical protein
VKKAMVDNVQKGERGTMASKHGLNLFAESLAAGERESALHVRIERGVRQLNVERKVESSGKAKRAKQSKRIVHKSDARRHRRSNGASMNQIIDAFASQIFNNAAIDIVKERIDSQIAQLSVAPGHAQLKRVRRLVNVAVVVRRMRIGNRKRHIVNLTATLSNKHIIAIVNARLLITIIIIIMFILTMIIFLIECIASKHAKVKPNVAKQVHGGNFNMFSLVRLSLYCTYIFDQVAVPLQVGVHSPRKMMRRFDISAQRNVNVVAFDTQELVTNPATGYTQHYIVANAILRQRAFQNRKNSCLERIQFNRSFRCREHIQSYCFFIRFLCKSTRSQVLWQCSLASLDSREKVGKFDIAKRYAVSK